MATIFAWERWHGMVTPSKRCFPIVGSVGLFALRAVATHKLTDEEAALSLDQLAIKYPAPEIKDDQTPHP